MNPYFRTPPVVKNLIIANCMVFLAIWLIKPVAAILDYYGVLWPIITGRFHIYQSVTSMFLHADVSHLFFNMFALWMFGRTLEYELGSRRFFVYYFVCGIGAGLFHLAATGLFGEYNPALGASGAVMSLLMAFGIMHPNERIFVFPIPAPIKAKWFVIGYILLEIFLGWSGSNDNIAHFAHVGGMLWGAALLLYWRWKHKIFF